MPSPPLPVRVDKTVQYRVSISSFIVVFSVILDYISLYLVVFDMAIGRNFKGNIFLGIVVVSVSYRICQSLLSMKSFCVVSTTAL